MCDNYVLKGKSIIHVSWDSSPPGYQTVYDITDPDSYLVPVRVESGKHSKGEESIVYGYKTVTDFISENPSDEDRFVISPAFEDARPFYNGLAAVKRNGLWGYINEEGNVVVEFLYYEARDFQESATFAYKAYMTPADDTLLSGKLPEGYWVLIDRDGNNLIPAKKIEEAGNFQCGWAVVIFEKIVEDRYNYVNTNGEELLPVTNIHRKLEAFKNDIAIIHTGYDYFINTSGIKLFNTAIRRVRNFSDGLAAVESGRGLQSFTFIDKDGHFLLKDKFYQVCDFNYGYAFVIRDFNKPGYIIDKQGNKYLEDLNIYNMTRFNDEGYALAMSTIEITEMTTETLYYVIHVENLSQ